MPVTRTYGWAATRETLTPEQRARARQHWQKAKRYWVCVLRLAGYGRVGGEDPLEMAKRKYEERHTKACQRAHRLIDEVESDDFDRLDFVNAYADRMMNVHEVRAKGQNLAQLNAWYKVRYEREHPKLKAANQAVYRLGRENKKLRVQQEKHQEELETAKSQGMALYDQGVRNEKWAVERLERKVEALRKLNSDKAKEVEWLTVRKNAIEKGFEASTKRADNAEAGVRRLEGELRALRVYHGTRTERVQQLIQETQRLLEEKRAVEADRRRLRCALSEMSSSRWSPTAPEPETPPTPTTPTTAPDGPAPVDDAVVDGVAKLLRNGTFGTGVLV